MIYLKKKGQSAMEYLMTYGWAILIVIVVVAALYAMGVFKISPSVACSPCFGTSDFTYVDHTDTQLVIKGGPRELAVTGNGTAFSAGEQQNIDISSCAWTGGKCIVDIDYTITESDLTHKTQATLHQQ